MALLHFDCYVFFSFFFFKPSHVLVTKNYSRYSHNLAILFLKFNCSLILLPIRGDYPHKIGVDFKLRSKVMISKHPNFTSNGCRY